MAQNTQTYLERQEDDPAVAHLHMQGSQAPWRPDYRHAKHATTWRYTMAASGDAKIVGNLAARTIGKKGRSSVPLAGRRLP
jgi:hypothetical protein